MTNGCTGGCVGAVAMAGWVAPLYTFSAECPDCVVVDCARLLPPNTFALKPVVACGYAGCVAPMLQPAAACAGCVVPMPPTVVNGRLAGCVPSAGVPSAGGTGPKPNSNAGRLPLELWPVPVLLNVLLWNSRPSTY